MKLRFQIGLVGLFFMLGCGNISVCDCDSEARKENPNRETMAECEAMYKGKSFEEIEGELEQCGTLQQE